MNARGSQTAQPAPPHPQLPATAMATPLGLHPHGVLLQPQWLMVRSFLTNEEPALEARGRSGAGVQPPKRPGGETQVAGGGRLVSTIAPGSGGTLPPTCAPSTGRQQTSRMNA